MTPADATLSLNVIKTYIDASAGVLDAPTQAHLLADAVDVFESFHAAAPGTFSIEMPPRKAAHCFIQGCIQIAKN